MRVSGSFGNPETNIPSFFRLACSFVILFYTLRYFVFRFLRKLVSVWTTTTTNRLESIYVQQVLESSCGVFSMIFWFVNSFQITRTVCHAGTTHTHDLTGTCCCRSYRPITLVPRLLVLAFVFLSSYKCKNDYQLFSIVSPIRIFS